MTMFREAPAPKRAQLYLPPLSYEVTDSWIDYLGYEQFGWWLKFHSWVDRRPTKYTEQHIPYTLESVFDKLNVSRSSFYRKIQILWECGLIDIVEFEASERKSQKPKNILVYPYPFWDETKQYKPLEKLRDWKNDYESESKLAGMKGALLKKLKAKEIEEIEIVDNSPEIVDKPVENPVVDNVDNVDKYPPKSERVYPPKSERVTLPNLGANHSFNNLLINSNNPINYYNNSSLSEFKVKTTKEILAAYGFTEGERGRIIELIIKRNITGYCKQDLKEQAKSMLLKNDIRDRAVYFVNGLEKNIGREYPKPKKVEEETNTRNVPFYNWLDN